MNAPTTLLPTETDPFDLLASAPHADAATIADPGPTAAGSVTSTFAGGILTVFGDAANNAATVSRDAAGHLLVNGAQVAGATTATTTLIQVFGQAGDDTITLNEAKGALPNANLFGGTGNDTITGGSGNDQIFGQADNDTLNGKAGNDLLFGGAGNDVLTGGTGNDQVFGEAGDDRFVWNAGDGSDIVEGGDGTDTLEINGNNDAETFAITANGTRVRVDGPGGAVLDVATTERITLSAGGGDDVITAGNGIGTLVSQLTIDGGAGNDTIFGGDGNDTLIGGAGNDVINGGRGNDTAMLGTGDDTFNWNPGDGSDVVEGQGGVDTLVFNGSNAGEAMNIVANGPRVSMTRNIANIAMDLNGVEKLDVRLLGAADTMTVGDLSGTGVQQLHVALGSTIGGTAGDASIDSVSLTGRAGNDNVTIAGSAGAVTVTGLPEAVQIDGADSFDRLAVNTGDGNDKIDASQLVVGTMALSIDAGAGNDSVLGSRGDDFIDAGDGKDTVTGGAGNDTAFLGAGDDTFVWNPGDGSDVIEGQDGNDTLRFNGSNASENINVLANGGRTLVQRDVGAITMDLNGVERIVTDALAGSDHVTIGDLTGTGVGRVDVNFTATDAQLDSVTVNATQLDDATLHVRSAASGEIVVSGLAAETHVTGLGADDSLVVNGQGGNDTIDASGFAAGGATLTMNGGLGNDTLIGGAGNDLVNGGDGNDVAHMGAGDDTFVWNPGDDNDTVDGGTGHDTLQFNGANVSERIGISANAGHVLFTRDVANISMDLDNVEQIRFSALGGNDHIVVGDLTGTDVTRVDVDLGATPDGAADDVTATATAADDVINLVQDGTRIDVQGLQATVGVDHAEAGNDSIVVLGGAGDDVMIAQLVGAGAPHIVLDGGDGDDVLIAAQNGSTLLGGAGDDILIGGAGNDVLDGGTGDNVLIGGQGQNVFVVGRGQDALVASEVDIQNFTSGGLDADKIDLSAFGATMDYATLMAQASEHDGNVVFDLGAAGGMTLEGIALAELNVDDFIFASQGEVPAVEHAPVPEPLHA